MTTKNNLAATKIAIEKAAQLIEEMAMCIRSLDEYDDCEDACDQADEMVASLKLLAERLKDA